MHLQNDQCKCSWHSGMDPEQDLTFYFYRSPQRLSVAGHSEIDSRTPSSSCGLFIPLSMGKVLPHTEVMLPSYYHSLCIRQGHIRWSHTVIFIFVFLCGDNPRVNVTGLKPSQL